MAYPVVPTTISDSTSVQAIIEAEAGILDCMAKYFGDATNGVVALIQAETTIAGKLDLLNSILPAYSSKEASAAALITAAAKKYAADKNINPCSINC